MRRSSPAHLVSESGLSRSPVMATDTREVDPKYGRPDMSPHEFAKKPDHNSNDRPGVRGTHTKKESTDTTTPVAPISVNNWRWARRIEADERIADEALRKEEAARINALKQDG